MTWSLTGSGSPFRLVSRKLGPPAVPGRSSSRCLRVPRTEPGPDQSRACRPRSGRQEYLRQYATTDCMHSCAKGHLDSGTAQVGWQALRAVKFHRLSAPDQMACFRQRDLAPRPPTCCRILARLARPESGCASRHTPSQCADPPFSFREGSCELPDFGAIAGSAGRFRHCAPGS